MRAPAAEFAAVEDGDAPAGFGKVMSAGRPNNAAADHDHVPAVGHVGRPVRNGSAGSRTRVASAVTNADPVIRGMTLPSATRTDPSKTLPTTLSCRQTSPGRSFPSAYRQANLALVPVPHGERSYALPGQRTKLRLSALGCRGGPNNSMWSIRPPSAPVTPSRSRAWRTRQV